jgi:hypothetical protein
MNTEKIGVVTILQEGELVGMIYNNIRTRQRTWYKCVPMTEEEMVAIIEDTVEKKIPSSEA